MRPSEILGPDGPFARSVRGWTPRASQQVMADAVLEAFTRRRHLVVEAPTGVGKTLGYLVPAALAGERVIVSTNTKNLQDQLVDKDLPRLAAALGALGVRLGPSPPAGAAPVPGEVTYALMKGRANYLCLERLHRRTRQRSLPLLGTAGRHADASERSEADLLEEIEGWALTSPRGDRAELPGLPEPSALWDALDARSEACAGSRCPRHAACFVTRMREEGERAHIVVVNHHLLLSDLALRARAELAGDAARFGQVLPDAGLLVVDEAHALEAIAAEHFGGTIGLSKIERLLRDVTTLAAEQALLRDGSSLLGATARAGAAASTAFAELPRGEGRVLLAPGDPRLAVLAGTGARAEAALRDLAERLRELASLEPTVDGLARRADDAAAALRFVIAAEDPDYVYWSEGQGERGKLGASPVDVARLLDRFLFERFDAAVLTSATLSAGSDDGCRYFRRSVGVPEERSSTLALESAFDHASQAVILVPDEAPEPDETGAEERMADLAERAIRAVGGGALFLCTSHRGMRAFHRRLSPRLPYPCLVQGEKPKRALLAELVERAPAVLFATQSFWEGVDVPGDPLRIVLVDRLPFDVPTDPLVRARARRLEAEGKSAFAHDQLPRAILRLKQGFGRLIRSIDDRGAVVILDGRLRRRSYGARFLQALPPARRLGTVEELERWWRRRGSGEP